MKNENEKEKGKSDHLQSFNSSSFSFALKLSSDQYAIPKINMLCNLMLFENEVKAAVR